MRGIIEGRGRQSVRVPTRWTLNDIDIPGTAGGWKWMSSKVEVGSYIPWFIPRVLTQVVFSRISEPSTACYPLFSRPEANSSPLKIGGASSWKFGDSELGNHHCLGGKLLLVSGKVTTGTAGGWKCESGWFPTCFFSFFESVFSFWGGVERKIISPTIFRFHAGFGAYTPSP